MREMLNETRDELSIEVEGPMEDETFNLWIFIGRRLLKGQKDYGGFKFGEYDLNQMAAEELADLVVYLSAKAFLKGSHVDKG